MTRLCVPIVCRSSEQIRKDVVRAIEAGADLIELRIDTYDDIDDTLLLATQIEFPFLLTRRPERQGGESMEDDDFRIEQLQNHRNGFPEKTLVDLEWDSRRTMEFNELLNENAIVSQHDFKGRPATLTKLYVDMCRSDAGIVKLAWMARSIRDCVEALQLIDLRSKPTIAICMGEAGQVSRILCKKFGAYLTFASLYKQTATAPGQVTVDELKKVYRWDAIGRATKVYGVVGSPVGHSMSPAIHNAGFDAINFDGVYVPLLVEPSWESFKAFCETALEWKPLELSGLSITIPHKENALRYATEKGWKIDPLAESIGAVNTYDVVNKYATSTDYAAILDTITTSLGIDRDRLKGLRVAVIGAGGTGRTAVAALRHYGANVTILNRTRDRAEALASEFGAATESLASLATLEQDVFVNTTSLGMSPNTDASPFDGALPKLNDQTLVFDTVYNPIETKLLKQAKDAGAKTATGVEMFVRQAVGQFELWTKSKAPADVMRQVVISRLTANDRG
ncbi:MAG: type I 3-dehydroquinate dehydratase [Tepidisphaeraceae bacterium]